MCEVKFGLKFVLRPKFGLRHQFKPLDLAEVDLTHSVGLHTVDRSLYLAASVLTPGELV